MTHQLIRRFQMPGRTIEKRMVTSQETIRQTLIDQMRVEGFVPLYDIDPVWQWKWIEGDNYDFLLTMHGVYVGKEKSWEIDGITGGRKVPSTPKRP